MEIIHQIFGEGKEITLLQMAARAAAMFFFAFILIRLGGVRIFGKKSAFDEVIVIMLGAVLSRGVVAASPFFSTVAAGAVMIGIHRILAFLSYKSKGVESLLKGNCVDLYANGQILYHNLEKTCISRNDLFQSLKLETNKENFDGIERASMENNGRISFILKEKNV